MSNPIISGALITPSLSLIKIQASVVTGAPIEYEENSTINEHLEILANIKPDPTVIPTIKGMVFGIRGFISEIADDGVFEPTPIAHDPVDGAPYRIMPAVLRELDNDLTAEERKRYWLRKIVLIGGIRYIAYYGIRLPAQTEPAKNLVNRRVDGVDDIDTFVYKDYHLNPPQPKVADNSLNSESRVNTVNPDGNYVYSFVERSINITAFDAAEFMNVANIMLGNPNKANVSEIILYTGVDEDVNVDAGDGNQIQFKEMIGAQPAIYVSTSHNLSVSNEGVNNSVKLGQSKPFKIRSA